MMVTNLDGEYIEGHYYHVEGIFRVRNEKGGIRIYIEGKSAGEIDKPKDEFVTFN